MILTFFREIKKIIFFENFQNFGENPFKFSAFFYVTGPNQRNFEQKNSKIKLLDVLG
jgi:hypothetical protein